jgi:Putative MetA-pathway of phenol degradation
MRFTFATLLMLCLAAPALAQAPDPIAADRPGLADSSSVVGHGRLQVETGLQWEQRGEEHSLFLPTLLRVGVGDRFEARVEGNTLSMLSVDGARETGLAPTSFGLKTLLRSAHERTPSVGVIGRFYPASGSGVFAAGEPAADGRVALDWNLSERWSFEANGGVGWYEGDPDSHFMAALLAATLSYQSSPRLSWFADSGAQLPEVERGSSAVILDGGLAWAPKPNWQFDISAGTRAHGDTAAKPFVAVGVAYRIGRG